MTERPAPSSPAGGRPAAPSPTLAPLGEKELLDVRAALGRRVQQVEERARAAARSGDPAAVALAAQVIQFAQRIAEAAEREHALGLYEAGRALLGREVNNVFRLADAVATVRESLPDLVASAPDDAERRRVQRLTVVYADLDQCCRELANAVAAHNMARRKLIMPIIVKAKKQVDEVEDDRKD